MLIRLSATHRIFAAENKTKTAFMDTTVIIAIIISTIAAMVVTCRQRINIKTILYIYIINLK